MTVLMRKRALLTRRTFLSTAAASAAMLPDSGIGKPYLSRAAGRPLITHGVQSGDVSDGEAIVWARTDRPARMQVEVVDHGHLHNNSRYPVRGRAPRDGLHGQVAS